MIKGIFLVVLFLLGLFALFAFSAVMMEIKLDPSITLSNWKNALSVESLIESKSGKLHIALFIGLVIVGVCASFLSHRRRNKDGNKRS